MDIRFAWISVCLILALAADHTWALSPDDGTWIDATTAQVDWTDSSKWQDGRIAYGADRTAFFDGLNHTVGKTVNLSSPIVIGTIRYRDNGAVNRDMTISSSTSSVLIMSATNAPPRIWARNRTLSVDVVIEGTHGLELASDQVGRGVRLLKRNQYAGITSILDGAGSARVVYPGDFGFSDLVVQGDQSDVDPEVVVDHGRALHPAAHLTVLSGAQVELDFLGVVPGVADYADLYVSSLTVGGALLPDGVYGASTHPASFMGPGEIVVESVPAGFLLAGGVDADGGAALAWPSRFGKLYDVRETSDLVSGVWAHTATVEATPPTNQHALGTASLQRDFYQVAEREDYLQTTRAGVMGRLDQLITDFYLTDQNTTVGDIRHGQFHSSDNMRMSECTPVLIWCYLQPDSQYYQDPDVLNAAIWSVDYMCRAQGVNGGFNEYHGWCGVPDRTNGKSSVVGFTLHAIGNAITRMARLPEMQARLSENMDPNGTGTNDTPRRDAWKTMLAGAMPFQFSGSGRGHAPNQDLCALMGVYAVNEAYAALDRGTLLKTQAQIDVLADEIYYGQPSAASSRPNGRWFSPAGVLAESGHGDYGYDGNYGVGVSVRYLGGLAAKDPTSATFLADSYAEALQYFFIPDPTAPLGVFAENGIARRSTGDPLPPPMYAIGLGSGYHPALDRLYDLALPHFASAPAANMPFPSPHQFQVGVWAYCEWLDVLAHPKNVDYRLPAERDAAWEFRDDTLKILVTKPTGGVPTYYTEIWDTPDKARRHVHGQAAETIDTLNLFP